MAIEWYLSKNEQDQLAEQNAKLGHGWRLRSISMYGEPTDPSFAGLWNHVDGPLQTIVICDVADLNQELAAAAKRGTHPTMVTGAGDSRKNCRVLVVFEPGSQPSVVGHWKKLWYDSGDLLADDGEAGEQMRAGFSCAGLIAVREGNDTYVRVLWIPSDPQRAPLQWFETDRQDRLHDAVQTMRKHRTRLFNTFLLADPPQRIMLWDDPAIDQVHTFGLNRSDAFDKVGQAAKQGLVPLKISGAGVGDGRIYDIVFAKPDAKLPEWTFRKSASPFHAGAQNPFKNIDDYIKDFMTQRGIRVMQFAAANQGRLGYGRAYTWAEDDFPTAHATDLCEIGSTTKAITATAIMMLVQNQHPAFAAHGVNTKVYDILEASSTPWKDFTGHAPTDPRFHELTLDHLLSMVSGFGPFGANQSDSEIDALIKATVPGTTVHHPITPAQSMSYMAQRDADVFDGSTKPGEVCAYANMAFVVLGRVLEAVTGESYLKWLRDNVFGPLGVPPQRVQVGSVVPGENNELLYHLARPVPIDAWAHVNPAPGAPRPLVYPPYEGNGHTFEAHGALAMSIIDITRFCSSFVRPEGPLLMTPEGLAKMWGFKPQWTSLPGTNGTNLRGWNRLPIDGHGYIAHNGGTGGAESMSGVMEDGMAFGVLMATNTNGDGFDGTQLAWVSHELHAIRDAGKWPADDLFGHFGVTT